jgi:hypothetical protein
MGLCARRLWAICCIAAGRLVQSQPVENNTVGLVVTGINVQVGDPAAGSVFQTQVEVRAKVGLAVTFM